MHGQRTVLKVPEATAIAGKSIRTGSEQRERTYQFDYSYWTAGDTSKAGYASQEVVFGDIGEAVLGQALSGYHCCVFAYGQTGSGKSYTMMGGAGTEAGLIPRICEQLFKRGLDSNESTYHVEVSYLEIYNERVRDLLNPRTSGSLRVREHPALGPYVEDLTTAAVSTYEEMLEHMSQGNKARTVAATSMNEASSRSHAVFTITLTRRTTQPLGGGVTERVSRIRLVDLAGSERAKSTMATGARLKEGGKINQSLAALGKVISALADQGKGKHMGFVAYRDSVLTWLLKDSLGGNSRTFMVATVSPADFYETLSTLRYADRAKHIVNQATVNEDATAKLVRELKEEVAGLRQRLLAAGPNNAPGGGDLEDRVRANEKLIAELNRTWEEKLRHTQRIQAEREQALAALGIAIDTSGLGLHAPRDIPHLVNLSEDPLMSECLVYNLKRGHTLVGSGDVDIRLSAAGGVAPRHCIFAHDDDHVTVHPIGESLVLVNGLRICEPKRLRSGFRVIIGNSFVFRFNHPQQARQEMNGGDSVSDSVASAETETAADWHYAWHEAHPDDGGGRYSPGMWSDTVSEFSDCTVDAASMSSAASPRTRFSQQLGVRPPRIRALSVAQQQQNQRLGANQAASNQRARGQTVSGGGCAEEVAAGDAAAGDAEQLRAGRRLAWLVGRAWRRYKLLRVGQTMLQNAVYLKEANVISKELGQKAVYQFAIVRGGAERFPVSPLEPDALPALLVADAETHLDCTARAAYEPAVVVVKVLDIAHACWYVWALAAFRAQLDKMRRLSAVKGSYREHLVLDPFHAHPAPRFSCVGTATVPIWLGARAYSARIDAPVVDALSGLERGRVAGSLAALPLQGAGGGDQWSVIVHIKALHGVSEAEVSGVHCRLRLERMRLVAESSRLEAPATASQPLGGFGDGPVNVHFRRQWTVAAVGADARVVVEVFGAAQALALRRAFHEDVQLELDESAGAPSGPRLSASQNLLVERLHEEELFVDSQHEITAWLHVLELGADGSWERAPCVATAPGGHMSQAFALRQGLQRRVGVCVGHSASRHLRIRRVAELRIGRPVLVDAKGHAMAAPSTAPLARLPVADVCLADDMRVDNRCFVTAAAAWDTSVYACGLLNAPTRRGAHVRLALELVLEIENGDGPVALATEILAHVRPRSEASGKSTGAGWLAGLFQAAAAAEPEEAGEDERGPVFRIFSLTLSPVGAAGGACDLWRLNTGKKYVRGEEALLPWRPRSVRLVDDFRRAEHDAAWREAVARARQRVEALGPPPADVAAEAARNVAAVLRALHADAPPLLTLAQERLRRRVREAARRIAAFRCVPGGGLLRLRQDPLQAPGALAAGLQPRRACGVRPITMLGHCCHRGWVDMLDTSGATRWVRRWLVVERPHVFVFFDSQCRLLDDVINVSAARMRVDPHVSELLGRDGVLALYTATSSYMLCPPPAEMQQWISAIDEWYFIL
ncbi:hypothetical protein GGI04_002337 [Coemansia thaxteri]|nr:hypothetical protein GGI04_002337 [Coemansia thaxteri]